MNKNKSYSEFITLSLELPVLHVDHFIFKPSVRLTSVAYLRQYHLD